MSGRKHKLYTELEVEPPTCKKIRLESMLERLSLDNVPETTTRRPHYQINPLLDPTEPRKKVNKSVDFDAFISASMKETYRNYILRGLALIHYTHPLAVLILHFQSWVRRLFNRFVRKYNKRNIDGRTIRVFKDFSKIIALTRDATISFTYGDLINIVLEENALEAHRLQLKRDKALDDRKLSEIKDEEELARESSYTYWDKISQLSNDIQMDGYEMDTTETRHIDEDMMGYIADCETTEYPLEANYGNYYETCHPGLHIQ